MEVLVALAVIGVATWVILSLFMSSMKLETNARSMRVAADLARDRLADIVARPEAYQWPDSESITVETGAPLILKDGDEQPDFAMPAVLPAHARAREKEARFFERFAWQAYVKRPAAGQGHYELLVSVRWEEAQRPQQLVLTGSIPIGMTKEAS